jgi:hypothetical protein
MAQTTAISKYIAERYPALHPPEHSADIKRLLEEMHAMNFFTLSFVKSPKLASGFADAALKRLENLDISDEYRKALEYKLMMSVISFPLRHMVFVHVSCPPFVSDTSRDFT